MTSVGVIIPARNEAEELPATLARLRAIKPELSVVLVDGGSTDETVAIARSAGAEVILSPVGCRGLQINLGIEACRADVAWVIHADTWVDASHLASLRAAMESNPKLLGGAFCRSFRSASPVLRWTCRMAAVRNHTLGWHLGDQAMFVRKKAWAGVGRFPEWSRFEDLEFSRRLGRAGVVASLKPWVSTSARRFEGGGSVRVTVRDFFLTIQYLAGWEARRRLRSTQ